MAHPPNLHLPERSFQGWDQLVFAASGVMNVNTAEGTWVVPPHRAVWIPAGVSHEVRMTGRVVLRSVFFRASFTRRRLPRSCLAVSVSPLLRELVLHVCRLGLLWKEQASEARLARVLLDQFEPWPMVPLQLPLPREPRARRTAEVLMQNPGCRDAMMKAIRAARASRRNLERLFVRETGLTLGRFHRRSRLIEALRGLAQDRAVTRVAFDVGYSTPSAFIAAFKAELGTTPARYFGAVAEVPTVALD